jgi:Rad3-related DNA helicase
MGQKIQGMSMAFKKTPPPLVVPDSPEKILLDLPRRKIPGVLLHQGEIMRAYAAKAVNVPDVALQLPTGSGKTLVGLIIGEWRRRKLRERVVYLCPNRQLVNQVVEHADEQYGLTVNGFTGPINRYDPAAKAEYKNADRIAITTYSALFNINPFFDNAQTIIVDDAHASENYIAALWTLRIDRTEHEALHTAVAGLLKSIIDSINYTRLIGKLENLADFAWVDKVPTPELMRTREEFINVIDTHVGELDLRYPWSMLRDHLHACQLYLTPQEILYAPAYPANMVSQTIRKR